MRKQQESLIRKSSSATVPSSSNIGNSNVGKSLIGSERSGQRNGQSKNYPSLMAKSTPLSDSPFSFAKSSSSLPSKSTKSTSSNQTNTTNTTTKSFSTTAKNVNNYRDPENQNMKSIQSIKNSLHHRSNQILSPQCKNKQSQPTSGTVNNGSTKHVKFVIPDRTIPKPTKDKPNTYTINYFNRAKIPQNSQTTHDSQPSQTTTGNKRTFDDFNSPSTTQSHSITNPKFDSSKKQKKDNNMLKFQKNLFEIQRELSEQPFISSANPLTPSPESNGQAIFNGKEEKANSTNFMILSDSQDSIALLEDIFNIDESIVEEAIAKIYNSKLGKSLSSSTKEKYLRNLINLEEISRLGLKDLFGEYYPSTGSFALKDNKPLFKLLSDGSLRNITEATGKSVYYSYSRLARLLMSLDLGRAMLFVNFSEDDWDQEEKRIVIEKVCLDGFCHSSIEYKFFGTSNSGINGYTALFIDTRLNFAEIHNLLGDFSECAKSGPRKAFSRIALSLGKSFQSLVELKKDELWVLYDEEDFPGVDGAGFMHEDYFQEILKNTICTPYFEQRKSTSEGTFLDCKIDEIVAMQFRALGMKGVFQSVPDEYWKELQIRHGFSDAVKCVARPSMIKFTGNSEVYRYFDVLNVSRIQGGSINRTFMSCMLRCTHHKDAMQQLFINMLDEFIKNESNIQDPKFLYNSLLSNDVFDSGDSVYRMVKNLLLAGFGMENPFVYKYIKKRIKARFQSMIDNKLCLKLKSKFSVTLMGVIDESGELNADEVYVPCLKLQEQLLRDYYKLKEVIVYRHPLAYEGDVAKLKLRKDPCNSFLASRSNVIVFPKVFKQKSPHQYLAGGDLDGDVYEVIFDLEILKLFDKPAERIDYDEGKQTSANTESSQPLTKLQPHDIIREHVKCFIQKHTHTGLLFYFNTIARDSNDTKLKKDLAKAYSDSIDSMKGSEQDFNKLIERARALPVPYWYQQWKVVKVSKWIPTDTNITIFENLMLNKVVQAYQQIGFKKPTEIDPDLIIETPPDILMWKIDFENAYKAWNDYWKNKKRVFESTQVDFTFNDRLFNDKLNTIMANMMSYQNKNKNNDEPDWHELFCGKTIGKQLVAKASLWMQLAHEKEKELTQKRGEYKKSILKSPFLYTCALHYLQMLKSREYKYLVHPNVRVKIC